MRMQYVVLFICGIFVLVGLAIAVYGFTILQSARASQTWILTDGQITKSEVISNSDSDGVTYSPEIQYSYLINGQDHVGTRIYFGDNRSSGDGGYARKYTQ